MAGWTGALTFGMLALFIVTTETDWSWMEVAGVTAGGAAIGGVLVGPYMKYLFNSPEMHIWHHSYDLPPEHPKGINFGLTLAIWDYMFKTASIPHDGRDIRLGFPGIEEFPDSFVSQNLHGFRGEE